jgi:ferrochelatase
VPAPHAAARRPLPLRVPRRPRASLAERLGHATRTEYKVTFPVAPGPSKWLEPYTEPTLIALAKSGVKRVDVVCPGFTSDCLETLEEIDMEGRAAFLLAGGKAFHYIPCLNDDPEWITALCNISERHLGGWDTQKAPNPLDFAESRKEALALGAKQ